MLYAVSDRETISTLTSSIGFTAAKLAPTRGTIHYAIIQAIDGVVRFAIDGTAPIANTTGLRLLQDASVEVWGSEALKNFRCINDGGTAKLEVVYMGVGL